ncbi:MAG: histone-like protein 2 [Methanobacteriota archaeon]|nr:MAG: histone-like protein 2 [Euryarchaeota archaeon]
MGSGASKFAGLFRRGDSGDTKPAAKKLAAKKAAAKKPAAKKAAAKKPAAKKAVAKKKAKPDYGAMTRAQLKVALKKKGLPVSGKKAELVKRLQKA